MEEKKADNKELVKKEIKVIDDDITISKETLKHLNNIEENFIALNYSLTKCIELLKSSMGGKQVNNILENVSEVKNKNMKYSLKDLDTCREIEEKKIKEYTVLKEELEKKDKKE